MGVHGGAEICLQPGKEPMMEQEEVPRGGSDPGGSPHWIRLLAGPLERLETGDPCWSSLFLKDCTLWQEDTWKRHAGAGEENEEEGAAGTR